MNSFTIGDALGYGWRGFWKNLGPLLIVAVAVFAVQLILNAIGTQVDSSVGVGLLNFVGWVISIVIALGWIRVGLSITRGETVEVADMFRFDGWLRYVVASILFGIGVGIGLVLLIVPGIIFGIVYGFFGWVIVDRDAGVGDAFTRSAEITRGNRWNLFALGLVLILVNLVGVLLFLVGVLFTMGISLVTLAYVYRVISSEEPAAIA